MLLQGKGSYYYYYYYNVQTSREYNVHDMINNY